MSTTKPQPAEGDDMARPIASVHLDIARFSWEVGRLKSAMDRADWLEKFAEALVMRDGRIHEYAGILLAEAGAFIEEKSQKARESARARYEKPAKDAENATAGDRSQSQPVAGERMRSDATEHTEHTEHSGHSNNGSIVGDGKDEGIAFCRRIISYLNEKAGKAYRIGKATQTIIQARQADGFTEEEFRKVIDTKVATWKGTDYEQYLRPETLFRASKMDGYLNEVPRARGSMPAGGRPANGYPRQDGRPALDFIDVHKAGE